MKKIILVLILSTLTLTLVSCNNDNNEKTSSVKNLNNDKKFQSLVEKNFSFNNKIINAKSKDIISFIESKNLENLSNKLNYKSTEDLKTDLNSQFTLINYIIENYDVKKYDEQQLKEIIINEINQLENFDTNRADPNDCRRKFRNDIIIITSAAVAGHIACGTVDLTVILGGICHGAVIATQAAASDNAALEFQKCLKS